MSNFVFFDAGFDNKQTSTYDLSIQVSLDGFSFSLINPKGRKCLALKKVNLDPATSRNPTDLLKEKILHEELLNKTYNSSSMLWITQKTTLIPSEYFSEKNALSCFRLCHQIKKSEKLLWHKIPKLGCHQIFSVPKDILNFFQKQFPNLKIFHHAYPFILTAKGELNGNHPIVNVNIEKQFIDTIIIMKDNQHFFNSFKYQETTDLVYHIMNIYNQRKLNPLQSKLIVSGLINYNDKAFYLLEKYIKNIELKKIPENIKGTQNIVTYKKPHFVNLLSLSMCE